MVKNYALKLAALSIVLLSGILAKAQYTFSVEGKRLSNYEFVSYGLGLSGCKIVESEKSGKPKALIGFGLSGIMPKTYNYTYSSYSIENDEDLVEAKYKARHSAYLLSLLTSYYFIGNLDSKFAMRFNLNASYMLQPYKYTFTPPEGEESNPGFENFKGSLKGFIFGLGLGVNVKVGEGSIFADAGILLPANEANGVAFQPELSPGTMLNLGYRMNLNLGGGSDRSASKSQRTRGVKSRSRSSYNAGHGSSVNRKPKKRKAPKTRSRSSSRKSFRFN